MVDAYVAQLWTARADVEAWVASVQALGHPYEFRLANSSVPVLVLNGEEDFPPDQIGSQIPGARQQTVPGNHVTAPLFPEFATS